MGGTPSVIGSGGGGDTTNSFLSPAPASNPYYDPYGPSGGKFGYMNLAGEALQQESLAGLQQNYSLALNEMTAPELSSYTSYLNQMTSADPTQRVAAVAPAIGTEEQQQTQARENIANMPRGGANAYLTGESYIQESSDIGNLINSAYTSARQAQGQLGEWGVASTEAGLSETEAGLSAAASETGAALNLKSGQQAQNQAMITSSAESIASLIAMLP